VVIRSGLPLTAAGLPLTAAGLPVGCLVAVRRGSETGGTIGGSHMRQLKKTTALTATVIALCAGAVLGAPAAGAAAQPAEARGSTSAMDPGPPDCNAGNNGAYWTDPWNGRVYRCMWDGSYWSWVWVA
jgi:hypothetical protein